MHSNYCHFFNIFYALPKDWHFLPQQSDSSCVQRDRADCCHDGNFSNWGLFSPCQQLCIYWLRILFQYFGRRLITRLQLARQLVRWDGNWHWHGSRRRRMTTSTSPCFASPPPSPTSTWLLSSLLASSKSPPATWTISFRVGCPSWWDCLVSPRSQLCSSFSWS